MKTISISILLLFLVSCGKHEKPAEVVYTIKEGEKVESLGDAEGELEYQVKSGESIPPKANELHQKARMMGQQGKYDEAIKLLDEACGIAPNWAYPHYDKAFTYLLMGDVKAALENYKKVDSLKPKGFFTTKTAVWSLQKEADGQLPEGIYLAYVMLEWKQEEEKRQMLSQFVTKIPTFAPAWKDWALLEEDLEKRVEILDQGLEKDPDAETHGMMMLNKALAHSNTGNRVEAVAILERMISDSQTTDGNIALAKETLKTLP